MKKVPVVKIASPDSAGALAGLSLDATVAMADVAGAMRDGLLAFSAAAGLVVMQQMLAAELAQIVGDKHARLGAGRVGNSIPERRACVPARASRTSAAEP